MVSGVWTFPELSLGTPTVAVPKLARVILEKIYPRAQLWNCVRNKASNTGSGYGKFFQSPQGQTLEDITLVSSPITSSLHSICFHKGLLSPVETLHLLEMPVSVGHASRPGRTLLGPDMSHLMESIHFRKYQHEQHLYSRKYCKIFTQKVNDQLCKQTKIDVADTIVILGTKNGQSVP